MTWSPSWERPARPTNPGTAIDRSAAEMPPGECAPRRTLHVRLVTWDDRPAVGGQGVYVDELRRHLTLSGVQVSTVAGRGTHAVSYRSVTGRGHLDLSLALAWRSRLLTDGSPDVLHVSGGPGGIALLRHAKRPTVITAHHTHRQSHSWRGLRAVAGAVEAAGYRHAVRVAAVSASTAAAVIAMGVPAKQVEVVPPGIRRRVPPCPVERHPLRMAFVGRLEPDKGPLDAVAAMSAVARRVPGAHGVVIGDGSQTVAVAQVARAGGGHVRVLGRLDDDELATELARAAVVLVPSSFEGLGMVALEAMAAGAAVVGYDVDGLHDTVGRYGIVVPAGSVTALGDAVRWLLDNPGTTTAMARAAASAVTDQWSWARCATRFTALYREVTRC